VKSTLVLTGQQQPGEVAKAASLVGKTVNILVVR
jgi:hypothetical protein